MTIYSGRFSIFDSILIFIFGLVCVATGNGDNLSSGRRLSINKLQELENKFLFFSCHDRKPYSHKVFRRFQAKELSGKNFSPGHHFRRSTREMNGMEWNGMDWKRTGKDWKPIYPCQQISATFALLVCKPFKVLSRFAKNSIITLGFACRDNS